MKHIRVLMIALLAAALLAGCAAPAAPATPTAAPTATAVPPTETPLPPTETPVPPTATAVPPTPTITSTPAPKVTLRLGPGKFGSPIFLEVLDGEYKIKGGTTLLAGSAIGVEEDWLIFSPGMLIEVAEGGVTLGGTNYPAGTKLVTDGAGNLAELK